MAWTEKSLSSRSGVPSGPCSSHFPPNPIFPNIRYSNDFNHVHTPSQQTWPHKHQPITSTDTQTHPDRAETCSMSILAVLKMWNRKSGLYDICTCLSGSFTGCGPWHHGTVLHIHSPIGYLPNVHPIPSRILKPPSMVVFKSANSTTSRHLLFYSFTCSSLYVTDAVEPTKPCSKHIVCSLTLTRSKLI